MAVAPPPGQRPVLRALSELAVRSLSAVLPAVRRLEPHLAVVSTYADKGLDRIEGSLPVLNQPAAQVVANAKGAMTGVRDAVTKTVAGVKDSVASTITGVLDSTKGAVTDGVERTKSVVSGSLHAVLESRVVRLMSSGVETALTKSELLVDQYLPLTEEELEKEAKKVEGFDEVEKPSYYVRLGSLSAKLRARAYQQALGRVTDARQKSQETIAQLHSAVHLIEYARENVHNANQRIQDAQEKFYLLWVEWKRSTGHDDTDESHCAEHLESQTLNIALGLTRQLQSTCHTLLSSIQGLPWGVQGRAQQAGLLAGDICSALRGTASFPEVSDSLLAASKRQLQKVKESLDEVMDYLVNNTPLDWLVGPFYPELPKAQHRRVEPQHGAP